MIELKLNYTKINSYPKIVFSGDLFDRDKIFPPRACVNATPDLIQKKKITVSRQGHRKLLQFSKLFDRKKNCQ